MPPPRPSTRFARWRPLPAWLLLAGLILLMGQGLLHPPALPAPNDPGGGDGALYTAIDQRVRQGEQYHAAAAAEQRARHYPLRPVFTMRPPALAVLLGAVTPRSALYGLGLLGIAASIALALRLRATIHDQTRWLVACALAVAAATSLIQPAMVVWHEAWAALLTALALACRSERRWVPAVAIALAAAMIRELAAPLLPIMAWCAWRDGRRAEAAGWIAAIVLFLIAFLVHMLLWAQQITAADPVSQGWVRIGGWSFILSMMRNASVLTLLPMPMVAVVTPLALLGWWGLPGDFPRRVSLLLLLDVGLFMIVGRPINFYWGLLLAPLLPIGLAFAPAALGDLARAAAARHRQP